MNPSNSEKPADQPTPEPTLLTPSQIALARALDEAIAAFKYDGQRVIYVELTHLREMRQLIDDLEAQAAKVADLTRENERLAQAEKEWRALAKVGTWHADCRPNRQQAGRELAKSQEVIDKLADTITNLRAEADRDRLQRVVDEMRAWLEDERNGEEVVGRRAALAHLDLALAKETS